VLQPGDLIAAAATEAEDDRFDLTGLTGAQLARFEEGEQPSVTDACADPEVFEALLDCGSLPGMNGNQLGTLGSFGEFHRCGGKTLSGERNLTAIYSQLPLTVDKVGADVKPWPAPTLDRVDVPGG